MAGTSKGPIYAAVAANVGIAVAKFIGSSISGSSAMLSEGIHSLVDSGNGLLLLYGINRSKKAPDEEHPMGHGKELYFWSLVVAILIFALGGGISVYEGLKHIQHPETPGDPTINYIVLAVAMVFEGAALFLAIRSFNKVRRRNQMGFWEAIRRSKDPAAFAVIFEDTAALLGLIVAFGGVMASQITGNGMYDGIASLVIGVILAGIAVVLAAETKALLIGESALPSVRQSIKQIFADDPAVTKMGPPITLHFGPEEIMLAVEVEFDDDLTADEIEEAVKRIEANVREAHPGVKRIFIEAKALLKQPKLA